MSTALLERSASISPVTGYNKGIGGDATIPTYTVIIHPDTENGGYWATCELPNGGANTIGDTLKEVQANMFEAMDLYLEDYPDIKDYLLHFEVSNE